MKLLLVFALASTLAACDSGFTGTPDSFDCVSGATLSATIDGATSGNSSLTGACVEVSSGSSGNVLNISAFSDPVGSSGTDYARSVSLTIGGRAVGSYAFGSTTFGNYSTSTSANSTLAAGTAGQAVITEASGGRIRGTFRFTAPEEVTPAGGSTTRTGKTVTVAGQFDVPG